MSWRKYARGSREDEDRYDRIATVVLGVLLIGGALTFLLWPWING